MFRKTAPQENYLVSDEQTPTHNHFSIIGQLEDATFFPITAAGLSFFIARSVLILVHWQCTEKA